MRTPFPRLRRAAVLACIPLALTLACNDSSTNPETADISGTYSLQSIAGSPLPYTLQDGTNSLTITNDVLTVASDGTWSEAESYSQVVSGQTSTGTVSDGGTWSRSGTDVNFASATDGSLVYVGTYSQNTLTLDNGDGAAQVFRR